MNSSPIPNSPTRSPSLEGRAGTALRWALLVGSLACASAAQAHGEADDALPADPGVVFEAAAALRHLSADAALPSARLSGYLLQGDAGMDLQGTRLEHGTLGLAARLDDTWGGQLVVGQHGSDPAHLEAAWLQARHDTDDAAWLLSAGRQQPAMGAVLGGAGHLDRFGLVPLAARMAINDMWMDDGLQLGWRRDAGASAWRADVGVWRGRFFPGAADGGSAVPSLHLGWTQSAWAVDAMAARFKPQGRGSAVAGAAGHSHTAPLCDAALSKVVCFSGSSQLAAASVRWNGREAAQPWPVTLTAAGWLRRESGALESANGLADYRGNNQGGWLEAVWQVRPQWELGWRGERLSATHELNGPGASLLAVETQLTAYAPATRHTLMLGYSPADWADIRVEAGRESVAGTRMSFAALRLVLKYSTGPGRGH